MKINIETYEQYPMYGMADADYASLESVSCEVAAETVSRWARVMKEFGQVQIEMGKAVERAEAIQDAQEPA